LVRDLRKTSCMRIFTVCLFLLMITVAASQAQVREQAGFAQERSSLTQSISVYPNPAVEYIEINLDQLQASKVKITLHNIIGNEVQAESEIIDDHKIRIRVKDFSSGYYLVALRDEQTNFRGTYKFLKR
jgi:hypothetical protein